VTNQNPKKSHKAGGGKESKRKKVWGQLDFTRLLSDLKNIFIKSSNGNKNAKSEQIKMALGLAVIVGICVGVYFYTSKPVAHKKVVHHHFAGAFDDKVGFEFDHARIVELQRGLDSANTKLNAFKKAQSTHSGTSEADSDVRTQKQIEQLQKQVAALTDALKQQASNVSRIKSNTRSDKPTHKKPFEKDTSNASKYSENQNKTNAMPVINTMGIEDESIFYPEDSTQAKRDSENYVWAGSFANGYLLTGIIGDAGTNSTKNTGTVAIRLTENGTMPNGTHSHLKGCVVLGSTYGDLSSDSDVIHLETLSCAGKKYSFEKKVYGSVFDLDAMQDLRGIPVLKAKPILGYAAVAGLISGIGAGVSASGTNTSVTGSGVIQTPASVFRSGLGQGISKPADKITDYLMAIANMYHPIVVAHAGRKVTVLFQAGFWIDKAHQGFESMKSIDTAHKPSDQDDKTQLQTNVPSSSKDNSFNQKLTEQVSGASGQVIKVAQNKASTDFKGKLHLGEGMFSPIPQ